MKVITANALTDGRVIYLGANNQWVEKLSMAKALSNEDADDALLLAKKRTLEVADIYLIEVGDDLQTSGREALRESIRAAGPTIRVDLGKQAELS